MCSLLIIPLCDFVYRLLLQWNHPTRRILRKTWWSRFGPERREEEEPFSCIFCRKRRLANFFHDNLIFKHTSFLHINKIFIPILSIAVLQHHNPPSTLLNRQHSSIAFIPFHVVPRFCLASIVLGTTSLNRSY
jgi:hypothetical protein